MHLHPLLKQPKANQKKSHPKIPSISICIIVHVIYMYIEIIISFQSGTNRATRLNLHRKYHINVYENHIIYSQTLVCTPNVIHTSRCSAVHTNDTIVVRSLSKFEHTKFQNLHNLFTIGRRFSSPFLLHSSLYPDPYKSNKYIESEKDPYCHTILNSIPEIIKL